MILIRPVISAIREAKKPVIVPFPRSMWGGQRLPEEAIRLNHAIALWDAIQRITGKKVDILCCGGLANHKGLSLAQDMHDYLVSQRPDLTSYVGIGESKCTWTGQQVRLMKEQGNLAGCDLILPISNKWHLHRIGVYLSFRFPKTKIIPMPSQSYGGLIRRFVNVLLETILYFLALTDRRGVRLDSQEQRRNLDAARHL